MKRRVSTLCAAVLLMSAAQAKPQQAYDIELPAQSVAAAQDGLSKQTGVPVLFPYDLAKDRKANPVAGRYTLLEALALLLDGTGLSGGLSEKSVLMISPKSDALKPRETDVNQNEQAENHNKKHTLRLMGAPLSLRRWAPP